MPMLSPPACPDLRELAVPKSYRVTLDPAAKTLSERRDPWMQQIVGESGTIYPHGSGNLAVEVDYRPISQKRIAKLPGAILVQDGDNEKTYVVPVEQFDAVCAIIKPRKRRQVSPEQRAASAERFKKYRFAKVK